MEYKVNKYQTELTEELIKSLTREEKIEVFKYIDGVPFIRNLMSDQRRYIKDMPKTEDGRVIPDLEDPHILEDTNYFRQPAIHFQEHGCYTNLYPNNHPNSEYKKFWQEEAQKCREGAVRETDGEWIPGYFYYYLNYSPIMKVTPVEGRQAHREHDFPDFYDGDYLYFHYIDQARQEGMHGSILKRRGVGASFKGAAMLGRNTVLGELAFTVKKRNSTNSFAIANEKEYLTKDGILNKYIDNLDWCSDTTPWPRMKIKNSLNDMSWKAGYIDKETGVERGSGNQVLGVTLKNDPQKARGKRGQLILWEESGKFSGLLTAWNIARESIEEGRFTFGTMLNFGTGGSEGADFTALEEMFYNPYGYNIYALNNVYDLNMEEGAKCSFFWGAYLNRKGYYDENGNSDVVGSLIEVIKDRIHVKNNSNDPNAVTQRKSENPIIPQEAILRVGQSIFPVSDVREALSTIKSDLGRFTNSHYTGEFTMGLDGHPLWKNKDLTPIREFPVADPKNKQGAVEIFHQPIKNHEGRVTPGRYISGLDPYDDDHSSTTSLGSIFIYDLFTERVVAEYTGRPRKADDFYEICRRLLLHYNAKANYENDKKGLYGYFYNKNCTHLLCDNPEILEEKNLAKVSHNYGNKKKGTNSSTAINAWARQLQADWLIEDAWGTGGVDEDGSQISPILNVYMVRSVAYLEEISKWNIDGNFDRVSSMGMLMIYRQEVKKFIESSKQQRHKTITDDPFFNRHMSRNNKTDMGKKLYDKHVFDMN